MHDTLYVVISQRWLWVAALIAAAIALASSIALQRFAGGLRRRWRIVLASLAAPAVSLLLATGLILYLSQQAPTDGSDLAWAAVIGAGLQAATLAFVCGVPIALLAEWRQRA